jgi:hypothetical protein
MKLWPMHDRFKEMETTTSPLAGQEEKSAQSGQADVSNAPHQIWEHRAYVLQESYFLGISLEALSKTSCTPPSMIEVEETSVSWPSAAAH